jgi:hypothetical protein
MCAYRFYIIRFRFKDRVEYIPVETPIDSIIRSEQVPTVVLPSLSAPKKKELIFPFYAIESKTTDLEKKKPPMIIILSIRNNFLEERKTTRRGAFHFPKRKNSNANFRLSFDTSGKRIKE